MTPWSLAESPVKGYFTIPPLPLMVFYMMTLPVPVGCLMLFTIPPAVTLFLVVLLMIGAINPLAASLTVMMTDIGSMTGSMVSMSHNRNIKIAR